MDIGSYVIAERKRAARDKAEREDLEYDRQRAIESAEKASRDAKRAQMQAITEIENVQGDLVAANEELCEATAELTLAREFLRDKGLSAEFDDWASHRREE